MILIHLPNWRLVIKIPSKSRISIPYTRLLRSRRDTQKLVRLRERDSKSLMTAHFRSTGTLLRSNRDPKVTASIITRTKSSWTTSRLPLEVHRINFIRNHWSLRVHIIAVRAIMDHSNHLLLRTRSNVETSWCKTSKINWPSKRWIPKVFLATRDN